MIMETQQRRDMIAVFRRHNDNSHPHDSEEQAQQDFAFGGAPSPFRLVVLPLRRGNAEKQEDLPLQAAQQHVLDAVTVAAFQPGPGGPEQIHPKQEVLPLQATQQHVLDEFCNRLSTS